MSAWDDLPYSVKHVIERTASIADKTRRHSVWVRDLGREARKVREELKGNCQREEANARA